MGRVTIGTPTVDSRQTVMQTEVVAVPVHCALIFGHLRSISDWDVTTEAQSSANDNTCSKNSSEQECSNTCVIVLDHLRVGLAQVPHRVRTRQLTGSIHAMLTVHIDQDRQVWGKEHNSKKETFSSYFANKQLPQSNKQTCNTPSSTSMRTYGYLGITSICTNGHMGHTLMTQTRRAKTATRKKTHKLGERRKQVDIHPGDKGNAITHKVIQCNPLLQPQERSLQTHISTPSHTFTQTWQRREGVLHSDMHAHMHREHTR